MSRWRSATSSASKSPLRERERERERERARDAQPKPRTTHLRPERLLGLGERAGELSVVCLRARTRYGWPAEEKIVAALTKYKEDNALD